MRPREYDEPRKATAIRLPESLHHDLKEAAAAYGLTVNRMVEQAITEFLTDLPAKPNFTLTRDR